MWPPIWPRGGSGQRKLSGALLCRLSGFLLKLHCRNYRYRRLPGQSRSAGNWCGWRRTLVRVASGVVCVDLCQVISLSFLYTALSICLLPFQLELCYSTRNQTAIAPISVLPGPKRVKNDEIIESLAHAPSTLGIDGHTRGYM